MRLIAAAALALVSSHSVAAAAAGPAPARPLPEVPFERYSLGNGLQVILVENRRVPLVAVNLWYRVGAANESPGLTGFAHLFEHMMYAGTKHIPRGVSDRLLEAAGATESNAMTGFDHTSYFDTTPANQLELNLWTHADRMGYLLDVLDRTALANEQDVVRNELRENYENRPYGIAELQLYRELFPPGHPYRGAVIGTHADVQAARLEDVKAFFKRYYAPNNASLVIAGDFDRAEARRLVEKYFGTLRRGPDVPPVRVVTPPITAERRAVVRDRVELPRVTFAWLTPPAFAPGDAELDIAAHALAGGKSSRLYRRLVYELQIAQDVNAYQSSHRLASVFTLQATARPGRTAAEVEAALDRELKRFRDEGPGAEELARARNAIESDFVQGLEKLSGIADAMNRYAFHAGDPGYLARDLERYRTASAEAVRMAVLKHLAPTARVVMHVIPGEKDVGPQAPAPPAIEYPPGAGTEAVNAEEPWRNAVPKAAPARLPPLPVPKSFVLANGFTVIHHARRDLPTVSAMIVVRGGSGTNPPRRPGLAGLVADLLTEGTASRGALEIAEEAARLGATITAGAAADASVVQASVLSRNFEALLDLLADVVRNPAFAPEEIERQRTSRAAALAQQREDPAALAADVALAALYGSQHPYGFGPLGSERGLKAIRREDILAYWRRHYVPGNAALVVVGDIGEDELRSAAQKAFGDWPRGARPPLALPRPHPRRARVIVVDTPGAPSTALAVARIGAAQGEADAAAVQVMNTAFGELFSSRISMNLREGKGYTYAAGSAFSFRRGRGPYVIRATVRADATGAAVWEILGEVARMRREPPAGEELERARNWRLLSLPAGFETNAGVAGAFALIHAYGLDNDWFERLAQRLGAVDARQVAVAARRYMAPSAFRIVAVGDRAAIEPRLRGLGLGRIEVQAGRSR